jgi:glycosyltransferase involved in cell wall biosynthesis
LVKEAVAFCDAGYDVTVLYNLVADWAQVLDKEILAKAKWKYIQVGGVNKSHWQYQISRIRFAFYRFVNEKISIDFFPEKAHARCYKNLLNAAIKLKADWYIGHNPGAMSIAVNAAYITNAKAGFDFEDYHRGEYTERNNPSLKRQIKLEKKYLKKFIYLTAASTFIAKKILQDFSNDGISIEPILNSFSLQEQPLVDFDKIETNKLKLFWFSQHIGNNRGLQLVCEALVALNDDTISLTLLGNCTKDMELYFKNLMKGIEHSINFVSVLPSSALASFATLYDVGLALEPGFSVNNDLALSNKIFTYLLAGNAILFTETSMQKDFNDQYHAGLSFPINNKEALKKQILFFKDKQNLVKQRKHNYQLAKEKLNWENESQKLLALIN